MKANLAIKEMKQKQKLREYRPRNHAGVKYPGIIGDAAALGVHRNTLWQVLEGRTTSAPLMASYRALKAGQRNGGEG